MNKDAIDLKAASNSGEYRKISDNEEEVLDDGSDGNLRKLWIVSIVCLVFMIVEIIGGYIANSIAIMSDAAHLGSDLLGFIISIVSIYIARKTATHKMSYGYHRAEVIGALVSISIIWGLTIWLLFEATLRIMHPTPVNGGIMLIVSILGLAFNVIMGIILAYEGIDHAMHHHHDHEQSQHGGESEHKHDHVHDHSDPNHKHDHDHDHKHDHDKDDHKHEQGGKCGGHADSSGNINIRAALIHVLGDAIQNVGVIISGAIIYFHPKLVIVDAICTFVFAIIVFFSTIRILKDCLSVIMEGSPIDNVDKMSARLMKVEGVVEVHDIHVWSLSMGKVTMTCHLKSTDPQKSLLLATELINKKYGIYHTTIQVEDVNSEECKQTLH